MEAAATAAAEAAAAAANAQPKTVSAGVRHGAFITVAFLMLYYAFLLAQATMKRKLRAHYMEQGKKASL